MYVYLELLIIHLIDWASLVVAFKVYDVDRDGYISNGELFLVLKMMVGSNLKVCIFLFVNVALHVFSTTNTINFILFRINNCNK